MPKSTKAWPHILTKYFEYYKTKYQRMILHQDLLDFLLFLFKPFLLWMYEFISRTPILLNGYLLGLTHSCKMLKYGQTYFENLAFSTLFSRLCSCHVTYAFQSESTIYSCLNVKEPHCSKQARNLKFNWLQLDSNLEPLSF